MARLPALISTYAEVDGRPRKSIEWYARVARENGRISSAKRGAGAANMNATDAVNLILACNCADEAKDAPRIIDQLRSLRRGEDVVAREDIKLALKPIIIERSFGLALEALLRASDDLAKVFCDRLQRVLPDMDQGQHQALVGSMIGLEVELWKFGASITAWEAFLGRREEVCCVDFRPDLGKLLKDFYSPEPPSYRSIHIILSFEVFRRCAELIAHEAQ